MTRAEILPTDHADFVGIEKLKETHSHQLNNFRNWATAGNWRMFHGSHYDWWAFPISAPSSYGFAYSISEETLAKLKRDQDFLSDLAEGAHLLLLSWGWDYKTNSPISGASEDQAWAHWPIRLYKCWKSMRLFGCEIEEQACLEYASWIHGLGESFEYQGSDLFVGMSESRSKDL